MRKYILSGLMLLSISLNAQINKVEHFYVGSPKAGTLFNLFKTNLGLPVVWGYQTWGSFSSGGVSLGNVAFEFANYEGVTKTKFAGIALEPLQHIEEFIKVLDDVKVIHDSIEPNTFVMSNGTVAGWSNLSLKNLLPDEAGLFICDYKSREKIFLNRKRSSDTLMNNNGGPLGVIFLKEIVIGSTNFLSNKNELAKLPGIKMTEDAVFSFVQGPSLRLINSNSNGIEKIIIKVHSVENAKQYLKSQNLMGKSTEHSVFINALAIDGLMVELTDE